MDSSWQTINMHAITGPETLNENAIHGGSDHVFCKKGKLIEAIPQLT